MEKKRTEIGQKEQRLGSSLAPRLHCRSCYTVYWSAVRCESNEPMHVHRLAGGFGWCQARMVCHFSQVGL